MYFLLCLINYLENCLIYIDYDWLGNENDWKSWLVQNKKKIGFMILEGFRKNKHNYITCIDTMYHMPQPLIIIRWDHSLIGEACFNLLLY